MQLVKFEKRETDLTELNELLILEVGEGLLAYKK